MQVERQRGGNLAASGERVSNTSERTQLWGITRRKPANTAYDLRVKGGDRKTSRIGAADGGLASW
jgi:hypothetical protein